MSALVNNYTKIKCLGVCEGYTNHMWDLNRIIFSKDEENHDFDVDVCGVNHFSFILRGSYKGKDLFEILNSAIYKENWKKVKLNKIWSINSRKSMIKGLYRIVDIYKKFGILIFSSEGDGMSHLFYQDALNEVLKNRKKKTKGQIKKEIKMWEEMRKKEDERFFSFANKELDNDFWEYGWKKTGNLNFRKDKNSIFVKVIKGLSGEREKIVTSQLNKGAVKDFPERFVLEYSQIIEGKNIKPVENLFIPENMYGLISSLSQHQTLLADAIYQKDPKILLHALFSYPVKQTYKETKNLWKELLDINKDEIFSSFQKLKSFLNF